MCARTEIGWPPSTPKWKRAQADQGLPLRNLYYSPSLAGEKDDAERIVTELFAFWMSNPSALPHYYQEKAEQESLPRVVCDYIAGMTDHFIIEQHEKHCGTCALRHALKQHIALHAVALLRRKCFFLLRPPHRRDPTSVGELRTETSGLLIGEKSRVHSLPGSARPQGQG